MEQRFLKIHHDDNVVVALTDLKRGSSISLSPDTLILASDIPAKHKFAARNLDAGDPVIMYAVLVGRTTRVIQSGELISTQNTIHEAASFRAKSSDYTWNEPDVSRWRQRTFLGYKRSDGQVGTRNYWLVIPLVFCETRNISVIQQAFEEELGLAAPQIHRRQVAQFVKLYREGRLAELREDSFEKEDPQATRQLVFKNIDGIKFLTHTGGCGGTREDSNNLCGLLAGYIHNPNVAGATILSLGCQNAQASILSEEIKKRNPDNAKPVLIFDQQHSGSEFKMISEAIVKTLLGLVEANRCERTPASLAHLTLGLKCGGSDGFSGISANPAVGHAADLLTALGGKGILSEFPELCGVEQALIDRCNDHRDGDRLIQLMRAYAARAKAIGSGFDMNPSPGNIRDGLVTDAMKSAGAAKKGGTSPVIAVLDYPEYATKAGLNLLCTPGNDVESVTAQVGSGANVVLFTTGLGTPTGNPVAPVIKIATNTTLAEKMHDIIDINAGEIVCGQKTVEQMGEEILETVIRVASGEIKTKAETLAQNDFIPWKRGISL
jgi:altronate hydrolase